MKTELPEINRWLKLQRIYDGKTQMDVAKSLKLKSPQVVSNYERGAAKLSPRIVTKICKRNGWKLRDAEEIMVAEYRAKLKKLIKGVK